ncbi:MAG TPA: hypothetical protein VIV40_12345 [Kofleriaceae bacterium]
MTKQSFLRSFLVTAIPFSLAMGLFYATSAGLARGMITGVAAGFAFGLAMAGFARFQARRFQPFVSMFEPEGLVVDGPATLRGTGGWLILTKQRLVFQPNQLKEGNRTEVVADDIAGARPGDSVVPNTIAVVTRTGQTLQFVVRGRAEWLAKLPGIKR